MNRFGNSLRRHAGLCFLLMIVLALGSYRLSESPQTGYDEGILIQMAGNFFQRGSFAVQTAPDQFRSGAYMTTAYPALFPVAVAMQFFGSTIFTARGVMLLFLLAFTTVFYFAAERVFGRRNAFLATALMVTHGSLYVYGKSLMGEIPGLFYLMLFLLGLGKLERTKTRPLPLVIATAVALGLAAVTKPIFLLSLPAGLCTLFFYRKRLPVNARTVAAATVSILLCVGIWFATHFSWDDQFGSVLQFYRDPYQLTDVAGVIQANLRRFVTEATPAFVMALSIIWGASLLLRAKKRDVPAVEFFCMTFVLLVFLAYLRTPGFYRYFFLANVVINLVFPYALEGLIRTVFERFPVWRADHVAKDVTVAFCLLLVLAQGYRLVNGSFISTTYTSTQTADLVDYFQNTFDRNAQPYLYDAPDIVPFLTSNRYSQWIEVSGEGLFAYGPTLKEAIAAETKFIIVTGKRRLKEQDRFVGYQEIAHIGRYVILQRQEETAQAL